ncbi:hypothetical protein K457DRAFT_18889 [Linnemannia elongata AG-77]|uniref:Uncharacterized protein n=1 Tax=Linnemannia elongata AG-77 TaxID=1314771 RepID=A0A197JZM9_9FUNG|nr:hypothetical protein K457DRAFT_18889 [Linnemannia elongata AG-77]
MTKPYRHQEISSTTKVSPSAAARGDRRVQELAKAKARVKKLVAMLRTRNTYSKECTSSDTSLAPKSKYTTATTEIDPDNHAKEKPSSAETDSINSAMPKSLAAGRLLRRMKKSLLGSSRLSFLLKTTTLKEVSSNVQYAPLRPATKAPLSKVSAVAIEPSTSTSTPNMASSSSDAPPLSTVATNDNCRSSSKPGDTSGSNSDER